MPEKIKLTETVTSRSIELPAYQKATLPWEKLPDETPLWFSRFIIYRDLPKADRKVKLAFKEFTAHSNQERLDSTIYLKKRSPVSLEGIHQSWYDAADRYKWEERAGLYDEHKDRLIRETRDNELKKVQKEIIARQLVTRRKMHDAMIERSINDLQLLDKPLKASEIANFFRIGAQDQDKVNELLYPRPDKQSRVAGQLNAIAGHSSSSVQELISRMEDGRPKEVIEMEAKMLLDNQSTTTPQPTQKQEVEYFEGD